MMEVVIVDDGNRLTVYELVERLSLASLQSTIAKTIFKAFVRRLGTC